MIDRNKYVVFKRDEFVKWWQQPEIGGVRCTAGIHCPDELTDSVVLRLKDVFAAPALYTYASTIHSLLELMDAAGGPMDEDQKQHLRELADYFAGEADMSRQMTGKKVPC